MVSSLVGRCCVFSLSPFAWGCIPLLFCWVVLLGFLLHHGWCCFFSFSFWRCCFPSPPFGGAACSPSFLLGGTAWLPSSFWVVLLFFLLLVVVLPPFPSFFGGAACSPSVVGWCCLRTSHQCSFGVGSLAPNPPCVLSRGSIWHVSALRR